MTLRETEASRYTERDTPIFTCISCPVADALRSLGGTAAALLTAD
jgi:chlorite dismutase